ncbi:MAG: LysR family transcriptional regulator [Burkholderiales bacterium]|nr:LysR family transcriptional regulator [Burkholderiales bacterium]ODU66322.1 MAG: hypothetical protein ABT05_05600 [Lautropia sp. SCN 66-9]
MENLNFMRVFVKVGETRSFTQAGKQLGLTASAVSKAISRMERELGATLLQRTTRSVGLTDDGRRFFEHCREILADIERARHMLDQSSSSPHGTLRLHIPIGFGQRVIMPALPKFLESHPHLVVDAEFSDRSVDMVYEGIDVAVVIGELADSRLIARHLGDLSFIVCASPEYLARHGEPRSPDDLAHHHCLAYRQMHTGRYREWQFQKDGKPIHKALSGRFNVNNSHALMEAAKSGVGIAMTSTLIAGDALRSGELKRLMPDYDCLGPPVSAVYPASRYLAPKSRAFIDFLVRIVAEHGDAV